MRVDFTHDMYLPDPRRRVQKNRPTPARDRADQAGIRPDPNGSIEQRQAWMRSRQLQPRDKLSFARFLTIGEYAIACMYYRLERQHERDEAEEVLFKICREAVGGYKTRRVDRE